MEEVGTGLIVMLTYLPSSGESFLLIDKRMTLLFPGWWGIDGEWRARPRKVLSGASCVLGGEIFLAIMMPIDRAW